MYIIPVSSFVSHFPQFRGNELRAFVRPNVLWNSSPQHHILQSLDDLESSQLPRPRIARHSRVFSLIIVSMRIVLPSWVIVLTKS
jgi:hypothetical protein